MRASGQGLPELADRAVLIQLCVLPVCMDVPLLDKLLVLACFLIAERLLVTVGVLARYREEVPQLDLLAGFEGSRTSSV